MSKVSKWKLEKTKVKVVFRLQFHATHIPQTGWDKLFISFIPADTGKATAKTTKANVRNGSCKWADPIYETTRLIQDSKSKIYDEKLYKVVVAMGSSRASTLGEATINLADYVDALKPSAVTLPLHGCNFGTVLHITIQLLTSKTGFREFEQQRELRERGLQSGETTTDQADKVRVRVKLKADASELSSLDEEVNLTEEYAYSATGFDGSSNTSGSLYAEKQETSLTHEIDILKVKEDSSDHQNTAQGSTGSVHGWGSGNSVDNELAIACEENNRLRGSLESADSSFFNLKLEVSSLQSLAEELGADTQKLSYQLAGEISSSEELAKEVSDMKLECLKLKDDIIRLNDLKFSPQIPHIETSDHLVRNMQLQFLNGISIVEGKIRELQKKTYVDGENKYIFLELEALLNFLLDFKLGNGEVSHIRDEQIVIGNGLGLDLCPPESVLQHYSMSPLVSEVVNPIDAMKSQIFDLVRELDEVKVEKEALTRKMDQMECYYEALIHELEGNQKRMVGELQLVRNEHSACLYALSVSKNETEALREEMNQQMLRILDERHDLETFNKELEKRAATSEAALRRARLNYSIAVDKLQKDLELLSSQVISMFETNENLIKQALPSQEVDLKLQQNPGDDNATKLSGLRKRSAGGDIILEDLKRSFCMQEELYQKVEQELIEMYSVNLNLDVYSKALEQSLCDADGDIRIMKEKIGELVEELRISTGAQNCLMLTLQKATDDIHALNEYKSSSISQCSEMALQNQLLDDKLTSVSKENHLLAEKLKDSVLEIRSYESKYAASLAEKAEHEKLTTELSEKLMILKAESDQLVSSKENLEENIDFVGDKLADLLSSYNKQLKSVDIKDAILQLEEIQHNVCEKNCQLMEENQNLKSEKAIADVSLSTVGSEIRSLKQKFKSGLQDMLMKLDMSNALVDKLQGELESVANKLDLSSEIEEKYAQQNKVLLADLARLEDQMQELTSKNGQLVREISWLDSLAEELGRSKLDITGLMHDNQQLGLCIQDKTEESIKLLCENGCLKESLRSLRDELRDEKGYKDELEGKVRDLTFCLSKDQDKLTEFEQKHLDLEMEKSRLARLLSQQNVLIEKLEKNSSDQASFESQLLEMHDHSLTADVKLIYVSNHFEDLFEELVRNLGELQKRYHDKESMLSQSLVSEANLREEKHNLLASLESLKSDLDVSGAENKLLSDSYHEIKDQLKECKMKLTNYTMQASQVERLKNMMIDAEEEISYLSRSKEELEILVIVLKGKVVEQSFAITMLAEHKDELSRKLAEQVLRTEEFKNLSIHLKELKDKAEAEKRETEAPSATVQDSLRIAFIKEQYETKVQELQQRLSISKKHGEEMLLKLQDSINEIENRKKSEAVSLKKNEELLVKLSALEADLRSALAEKREKSNAYDRAKAELECALLSLECCKEEKEKLGVSLLEFEAEKSRLGVELTMVKGELENLKSSTSFEKDEYTLNGSTGNIFPLFLDQDESALLTLDGENEESTELVQLQKIQDAASFIQSNGKILEVNSKHLGAERLKSSMEHLQEELEKMKNENTVFNTGHDVDSDFQVAQGDIMQLHKANEELRSMFPLFNEISSGGNALERVLALEIELAEALKAKNKSNIQFQSSFLKQHSDEEAVFKSFRDINELIKEMLDLKGRHAAVEAELREMHDRYSELSLQFAEVEGERQKLKMTLKNVRTSRKLVSLNRSSSDNLMDDTL